MSKALRKDREERYQVARDLLLDLKSLRQRLEFEAELERFRESGSTDGAAVRPSDEVAVKVTDDQSIGNELAVETGEIATRATSSAEYLISEIKRRRIGSIIVLIILLIAASGIGLLLYRSIGERSATTFQPMKTVRLTTSGKVVSAAISQDGKYVAYVVEDGGQRSIWMKQVATSSNLQVLPPGQGRYAWLMFSHDGTYIYYNTGSALYQIPVLGGVTRKLIADVNSAITLAPDGNRLAFVRNYVGQQESALMIANADGTDERRLATRRSPEDFGCPAWSPDGKVIACALGSSSGGTNWSVVEVQVENGAMRPITTKNWYFGNRIVWLPDGSGILLSAQEKAAFPAQIWHLSYPGGEARRITNDFNSYIGLSVTSDSGAMVTVSYQRSSNIWLVPNGDVNSARQISPGGSRDDGTFGMSWTLQDRITYASNESGNWDIWITNSDGTNQRQLTVGVGGNLGPSVSFDGRYIVCDSDRAGGSDVWRMDPDGSNPKQLTTSGNISAPRASPDGNWVIYNAHSTPTAGTTLWKVSIDGGNSVQLTHNDSDNADISPDGKLVACFFNDEQPNSPWKIAVFPFEGGQPIKLFDIASTVNRARTLRWTRDGQSIAYIDDRSGVSNIWSQPLDGGTSKQLTDFTSDQIFSFDWSFDGRQLAVGRGSVMSDVVLLSNFR